MLTGPRGAWARTLPFESQWDDTIPLEDQNEPLFRGRSELAMPRLGLTAVSWKVALGQVLWFLAMTLGLVATAIVSALGLDSQQRLYGTVSVEAMQQVGLWSVLLCVSTISAVGVAAWLAPRLRQKARVVSLQILAMTFFGVPWTVLVTVLNYKAGLGLGEQMAALGSLVALVLWIRLQSRCWPT